MQLIYGVGVFSTLFLVALDVLVYREPNILVHIEVEYNGVFALKHDDGSDQEGKGGEG